MDRLKRVQQIFDESITLKTEAAFSLGPKIVEAADSILACLMANNKVMACGNGGSAADGCGAAVVGELRGVVDGDEKLLGVEVPVVADAAAGREDAAVDEVPRGFEVCGGEAAFKQPRRGTLVANAGLHFFAGGADQTHAVFLSS